MQIDPGTPLQDLGKEFSKARRLFRRLGVEIDAGSLQTVSQACDQAGISFKDFTRTLAAMTPEGGAHRSLEEWTQAPIHELVHHIQDRHHAYTRQELIRLGGILEEAVTAHGGQHPELTQIRSHFQGLREDLLKHLAMEDSVLFPSILQAAEDGQATPFSSIEDLHRMALKEHEAAEELFQNIGVLTHNFSLPLGVEPPVRALYLGLRDLEEDLFMHIYLENHLLFPRAVQPQPGP